jgi:uncharacterized membrane protein (UPF0127 family)
LPRRRKSRRGKPACFLITTIIIDTMRLSFILILAILVCKTGLAAENPKKICFNKDTCVSLEIADNDSSRERGLMFRKSLPESTGMLFIFPEEGVFSFWMKNTLIGLDMVWLDKDLKVVYIKPFAPPCESYDCPSYEPKVTAKYVLEVNAGFTGLNRIRVNDKAYLQYE